MTSKKSLVLLLILVLALVAGGGFYSYNKALSNSKSEGDKIVSRAVDVENDSEWQKKQVEKPKTPTNTTTKQSQPPAQKTETQSKLLKSGEFKELDPLHYASGKVNIVDKGEDVFVQLEDSFATNPDGPDLYVWLVKEQKLGGAIKGVDSTEGTYLDLGKLQKVSGTQTYKVSKAEFEQYNYAVVIWCRAFNVQFSNAVLN
jgi:hypothetical protein